MMTKLLTILPLFSACDADIKQQLEDDSFKKGRISIPLTAMSNSGANYIVELPYVSLESEFDALEFSLQDQTELDVSLHQGAWTFFVGEYALYREAEDGTFYFVESELVSTNPQQIQIFPDAVTRAQLNFRAENEDIVTDGSLEIEININDSDEDFMDTGSDFFSGAGMTCNPCDQSCVTSKAVACRADNPNATINVTYSVIPSPTTGNGICKVHCN